MKPFYFFLLIFAATTALIAAPTGEEKKPEFPRLTQVDTFPENHRDAVRAVIAALTANGYKPDEYFAAIWPDKEGLLVFSLQHQSHPASRLSERGDRCGRCRLAFYDPKSGKFLRFQGIR